MLKKKLSWALTKNFISDSKKFIEETQDMLDRGQALTCAARMEELIGLCKERKKGHSEEFFWVYAMACCLYEQAFSRFGKNSGTPFLGKAAELAEANGLKDIKFWINKCKLDRVVTCGGVGEFKKLKDLLIEAAENQKEKLSYKLLIMPVLTENAFNEGDLETAENLAKEMLELAVKLEDRNSQLSGNNLLGKVFFEKGEMKEAISYLESAISIGREKGLEQLIPALCNMARVLLTQNNTDEAEKYLNEAQEKLEKGSELKDTYYHIQLVRLQGVLALRQKKTDNVEEILRQAADMAKDQGNAFEEGKTHMALGRFFMEIQDFKKSALAFEEASGKFIVIDNEFQLARVKNIRDTLKQQELKDSIDKNDLRTPPASFQAEVLDEFMKLAISNLDVDTVLSHVINHIMRVTNADRGFIILFDEAGKPYSEVVRLKEKAGGDEGKGELLKNFSRTITKDVLEKKESVLYTDVQEDQEFAVAESIAGLDIRSVICVPLKKEKKEIVGLIYIDRQTLVKAFTQNDLSLVESLADYAAIALVNARMHSGIKKKLKSTEEQLVQSEKMATMGVLAGGVAHEINTPLGSILMNTEMLMKEIEKGAVDKDKLENIKESTSRCKEIVEMLLNYSRKTSTIFEEVDMNKVIDKTYDFLFKQISNDRVNIVKEQQADLPVISGNFTKLMQVFTNLIVNAKEAIRDVKDSGTVTIKSYLDGENVIVEVKDDGQGIAEGDVSQIFDPFFTTKDIGKGTGLGLSITFRIIEDHQGAINVVSELNEGATFIVSIPVKK